MFPETLRKSRLRVSGSRLQPKAYVPLNELGEACILLGILSVRRLAPMILAYFNRVRSWNSIECGEARRMDLECRGSPFPRSSPSPTDACQAAWLLFGMRLLTPAAACPQFVTKYPPSLPQPSLAARIHTLRPLRDQRRHLTPLGLFSCVCDPTERLLAQTPRNPAECAEESPSRHPLRRQRRYNKVSEEIGTRR